MFRKYAFVVETCFGLALLAAIDLFVVNKSGAFVSVHPHPYWIVILLIASRYGLAQGLFAGAMTAVSYIVLASHAGLVDFSSFVFPHGAYIMPFLFLLAGGVIGEIRNHYRKKYEKLHAKYESAQEDYDNLAIEHQALTGSKWELEKRIALQSTTMVSLFEQLTQIDQSEPMELYNRIPEILKEQLNVTCASVYVVDKNRLRRIVRKGEWPASPLPDILELTEGMVGEVVRRKAMVALNRDVSSGEMAKFQNHSLIMSAPILRKDGALVGVINVERIPFFDFTANAVKVFETLAQWVSIAVEQAMMFQHFKDKNVADEITGAFNYIHFQKRLAYEIARARRFEHPLSLLLLKIRYFDRMQPSEQKNILTVMNWIFSNIFRDTDIISKYRNESTFAVILPEQQAEDCQKIIERITNEIQNYGLKPFEGRDDVLQFRTGVSTLQASEGSYESMVKTAEERLWTGEIKRRAGIFDDIQYLMGQAGTGEQASAN